MDSSWPLVISDALWPFVVFVLGVIILFTQRDAVGKLIDRLKEGPGGLKFADARKAVEGLVENDEKLEFESAAAIKATTDEERRQSIESVIRQAAEWGWRRAAINPDTKPVPEVTWDDEGNPKITGRADLISVVQSIMLDRFRDAGAPPAEIRDWLLRDEVRRSARQRKPPGEPPTDASATT